MYRNLQTRHNTSWHWISVELVRLFVAAFLSLPSHVTLYLCIQLVIFLNTTWSVPFQFLIFLYSFIPNFAPFCFHFFIHHFLYVIIFQVGRTTLGGLLALGYNVVVSYKRSCTSIHNGQILMALESIDTLNETFLVLKGTSRKVWIPLTSGRNLLL